jgi:hypothetical protein
VRSARNSEECAWLLKAQILLLTDTRITPWIKWYIKSLDVLWVGTPTKRPVTERPVTRRPVTVTGRPVTKGPDYQTSKLPNVQLLKVQITKRPGNLDVW